MTAGTALAPDALQGQSVRSGAMANTLKKIEELQVVIEMARSAAGKGDTASAARVIQEMHIQTGILLHELRKPTAPSAKIYDLAAERCART